MPEYNIIIIENEQNGKIEIVSSFEQFCVTNRKHCVTDYFLYYIIDGINSVCMCVLFSSPSISPCLIPTTTVRERRQGAVVTGGGPSGVLRPLADASMSANQCDLGIGTERDVTFGGCQFEVGSDLLVL